MAEVAVAPKRTTRAELTGETARSARLADLGLFVGFLALTFLLGVFPLKDTDFWWHLRTGDLIRQTGKLPTVDTYTFGAEGHRWVDLHWIYQVLLSLGYATVGIPGLNLAKCAITCAAVALLFTARKRDWPVWTMILAWLPALLVLSGRMYVRPETLTLLYLAAYLAVLFRIDDRPRLAFLLPIVQVAWVNTQGLFVFGPALLGTALVAAVLRRGAFAEGRRRWWRTVLFATGLVGLACLVNPYGLAGALYPLQLLATMGNPLFAKSIAELKPLDVFIGEVGLTNGFVQLYLMTLVLGVLSFLLPVFSRVKPPAVAVATTKRKSKTTPADVESRPSGLVFRLILFVAFSALSVRATRNSHQYAAVVGTITAWNVGEWAAGLARARAEGGRGGRVNVGRLVAFIATGGLLLAVGSGGFYAWTAEGRTIGLGEEPHWFPHEAVAFAGRADMPTRSLCLHDGHAALYEYAYAPDRKTFIDARLEVVGADLYARYLDLDRKISRNTAGWEADLDAMGRPLILVDNVHAGMSSVSASLLTSKRYRCVWFDPVASLFVHEAYTGAVQAHAIDFGDRHFHPTEGSDHSDAPGETMMAKTCWNLIHNLFQKGAPRDLTRKLVWTGLDHARRFREFDPEGFDGWKWSAMIENYREPPSDPEPIARFRMPFDPVHDLSAVRASYAFRRALGARPDDGNALLGLAVLDDQRGLFESSLTLFDRFLALPTTSAAQRSSREVAALRRSRVALRLGEPPATLKWANRNELDRLINVLFAQGRAATAAEVLATAHPLDGRPWEVSDRIATIYLHLGEPARAIRVWTEAPNPPSEALRLARVGAARLAMEDFPRSRESYREAARLAPDLFEARFGLAILEADDGHAPEALDAARAASKLAPGPAGKSASEALIEAVNSYVNP